MYADCPNGPYDNAGVCDNCDANCVTCSGFVTSCDSCSSELYLYNYSCLE